MLVKKALDFFKTLDTLFLAREQTTSMSLLLFVTCLNFFKLLAGPINENGLKVFAKFQA